MLNRLFIAIGVLVILTLVTAFLVPRFINWSDYRPRLEGMASAAFGTKVSIEGDIALTLLPQPQVRFTKVRMGPADAPVVQIDDVEAEFSLLDFLRDAYSVTKLTIDHPVVNIAIGPDGAINSGLAVAEAGAQPNVTVPRADVVDGSIHIADARARKTYASENINGQLMLEAIRGPFSFEGNTSVNGVSYAVHVGLGRLDTAGGPPLSLLVQSAMDRSTLQTEGVLQAGPRYVGTLKYRHPPPAGKKGDQIDAGRGDFTIEGKLDAGTDRVLLSEYVALPDENRPTTRLTGAGELKLGATATFNAVISGGVVILPPRDATTELSDPPYELVRLLGELPLPPVPPIAGSVGLDVSELNLRAVSLRDLRIDAQTDGLNWTLKSLTASLPGNTTIGLSGTLSAAADKPIFAGQVTLASTQLDRLSALWRKPQAGNPLLDTPGSVSANVALSGDNFALSAGKLAVGDLTEPFDLEIGLGTQRSLKLDAKWGTLSANDSAAIAALLPDIAASGSFGATFQSGEVHLSADKASIFGIDGSGLVADASWEGGVLELDKLAATDLGGMSFNAKGTAFGTLIKPEISGLGSLKIAPGSAALAEALDAAGAPAPVVALLNRSLPADVTIKLDAPSGSGSQAMAVVGTLNGVDTKLAATLTAGVVNALKASASATLDMNAASPRQLMAQLGIATTPLFDESKPLHLTASVDGTPSNSYETHAELGNGTDRLAFAGNVVPGDFTSVTGSGDLEATLSDPTALAEALGAGGLYLPPIGGKAKLQFTDVDTFKLSNIDAGGVSGSLSLSHDAGRPMVAGSLTLPPIEMRWLLPFLVGASGTLSSSGPWPDGPIDLGDVPRGSEGRIDLKTASLGVGLAEPLADAEFGFDWDAQKLHLRNLSGKFGDGTLSADVTLCCSGTSLPTKQISGRIAVDGVSLASFEPSPIAMGITGKLQSTAQFEGTGATLAETIASLSGSGSYTVTGFGAPKFDPTLFTGLDGLTDMVDMEPDVLTATVTNKLTSGNFEASTLTGGFTIAGGVVRSPNLSISGQGAKIFGSGSLSLSNLTLDGRYTMTPTVAPGDSSALDPNTAEVAAVVSGPLWSPSVSYDVEAMVEGMKIKASEVELALLEQRKAEADARAKAQAEDDARRDAERKAEALAILAQQATEAAANAAFVAQAQAAKAAADAAAKANPQTPPPIALFPSSSSAPGGDAGL